MTAFEDGYWWSRDGVRLHYRRYPGDEARPALLCLPGLTRNARDFAALADRLAGKWQLICPEMRGRGESGYARDPLSYVPLTYLQDLELLISELEIARFVTIGTSLGGILAMLLAAAGPDRIAATVLNDVGPVLEPAGIARIRNYVGRGGSWPTWVHAARATSEHQRMSFPGYGLEEWIAMAKRLCRLTPAGRIVPDYDSRIAEPFRMPGGEAGIDLWPALETLRGKPALLVRGALSDVLSEDTAARMVARVAGMELVTVPGVGHAPTLSEPEAVAAIDRLLAKVGRD